MRRCSVKSFEGEEISEGKALAFSAMLVRVLIQTVATEGASFLGMAILYVVLRISPIYKNKLFIKIIYLKTPDFNVFIIYKIT
jgi:hypothetical protein